MAVVDYRDGTTIDEAIAELTRTWSEMGASFVRRIRPGPDHDVVVSGIMRALQSAPIPEAARLLSWHAGLDVPDQTRPIPVGEWMLIALDQSLEQHERFFDGMERSLAPPELVARWRSSWLPIAVNYSGDILFAIMNGSREGQVHRVFIIEPPHDDDQLHLYPGIPWVLTTWAWLLRERYRWHPMTEDPNDGGAWRKIDPSPTHGDTGKPWLGL